LKKIRLTSNWKSCPTDEFLVKRLNACFLTSNNINPKYEFTASDDFDYLVIINDTKENVNFSFPKEKTIIVYFEPSWHFYVWSTIKKNIGRSNYICSHNMEEVLNWGLLYEYIVDLKKINYSKKKFFNLNGLLPNHLNIENFDPDLNFCLNNVYKKNKKCSFIVSSRSGMGGTKANGIHKYGNLYETRLKLVEKILNSNLDIDIYGRGLKKLFGSHKKIKGQAEHKIDALKDYQFSIAIENTKEDGYFTEKLGDCILTDTTPIYMGCPNIQDYFSNIHILNPENSLEQIEEILNKNLILDQTENKKLFEFRYNFYNQIVGLIESYKI
jgi:hypothetical protein